MERITRSSVSPANIISIPASESKTKGDCIFYHQNITITHLLTPPPAMTLDQTTRISRLFYFHCALARSSAFFSTFRRSIFNTEAGEIFLKHVRLCRRSAPNPPMVFHLIKSQVFVTAHKAFIFEPQNLSESFTPVTP